MITFRYDLHSPWCFLASLRVEGIAARHGRAVDWVPVHLASLIERIGGRRPLEGLPQFVAWYRQDLRDWARLAGVELRQHPRFPLRPARALRAGCFAAAAGKGGAFARAALRAYWTEEADIEDVAVLARLGGEAGLEPAAVAAATGDPRWKAQVEANTAEAVAAGIFGLPACTVDGRLFWGNDRLEMMDHALAGRV